MLRLDKVIKPWKEAAALNDHINLYGFWNETVFLTKSGDVGIVLRVPGIDYESLDHSQQEYAVKRLEAALKHFGPGFHVYQYLFKQNRPEIPFASYDDPVVQAAIEQRKDFFEQKRDHLYQIEIYYCILLEGARSKTGLGAAFGRLLHDPAGAVDELRTQFTSNNMKTLLRAQIEQDASRLKQRTQAFVRQLSDFMQIEVLDQDGQFRFFRRLLNYDEWRIAGRAQSTQFLDYQAVNSNIEAERDHLRVGEQVTYDPSRLRGISAYQEMEREFAVGDRIQFTAPNRALHVANRDLGTIEHIGQDGPLSVRMDNGKTVIFDANEMRHFDHGYAVTSHSSQGLTAERVLVNMDTEVHPELLNSRLAYVSVSRASHEAHIYTNHAASLTESLNHDTTKTSAVTFSKEHSITAQQGMEQSVGQARMQDIGLSRAL